MQRLISQYASCAGSVFYNREADNPRLIQHCVCWRAPGHACGAERYPIGEVLIVIATPLLLIVPIAKSMVGRRRCNTDLILPYLCTDSSKGIVMRAHMFAGCFAGLLIASVLGIGTGVLVRYYALFDKLVLPTITLLSPMSRLSASTFSETGGLTLAGALPAQVD